MGLFDWLTGRMNRVEVAEDRIWLTQRAKHAGIYREAAQALADADGPCAVIVAAHFQDCLEQLQAAFIGSDRDRILITLADALGGRTSTDLAANESRNILIIVGERHPLPSHDEVVLGFARSQPCRCRLVYHVSLEDALLKRFSGEWVEGVLRRLGMKDGEAIESRMVGRRIQSALTKIAMNATGDAPANSAEEWLERNCP
jgi:hypothetical protein